MRVITGAITLLKDRFTMRVITGAITSIQGGNRLGDKGSDEQVNFGDDKIKCLIFSTDAG